jgi:predicted DNA-binding protein
MDPTTRPRRGRPPLDPRKRLSDKVEARISPAERERLNAILARRGITESEYMRELLAPVIAADELAAA